MSGFSFGKIIGIDDVVFFISLFSPYCLLCHGAENRVVTTNTGPILIILGFGGTNIVEFRCGGKH